MVYQFQYRLPNPLITLETYELVSRAGRPSRRLRRAIRRLPGPVSAYSFVALRARAALREVHCVRLPVGFWLTQPGVPPSGIWLRCYGLHQPHRSQPSPTKPVYASKVEPPRSDHEAKAGSGTELPMALSAKMLALIQKLDAAEAAHFARLTARAKQEAAARENAAERKRANLRVTRTAQTRAAKKDPKGQPREGSIGRAVDGVSSR